MTTTADRSLEHCSQCDDLRLHIAHTCTGCGHTASVIVDGDYMTPREARAALEAERTRRARARGVFTDSEDPTHLDYLIGRH